MKARKIRKRDRRNANHHEAFYESEPDFAYYWDDDGDERWTELEVARTPEGGTMTLMQRGEDLAIHVGSMELMASVQHSSEEALAEIAYDNYKKRNGTVKSSEAAGLRILIGGLGLGYTLRAALDAFPENAHITVAELIPKVVEWNRGILGRLANYPLKDPRVEVFVGDVRKAILTGPGWDMILLDVDNGPSATTVEKNNYLYQLEELENIYNRLLPGGVLAVWSVSKDQYFEQRLFKAGFRCQSVRVNAIKGDPDSDLHTIFLNWIEAR